MKYKTKLDFTSIYLMIAGVWISSGIENEALNFFFCSIMAGLSMVMFPIAKLVEDKSNDNEDDTK